MENNSKKLSANKIIEESEIYLSKIIDINENNNSEIEYLLEFFENISKKFLIFNQDNNFLEKENTNNNFSINLSDFYLQHQIILSSFYEISKNIKNIILKLNGFWDNLKKKYKNIIKKIIDIITNLKNENEKVEKYIQDKNNLNNINRNQQEKYILNYNLIDNANNLFLNSQKEFKKQLDGINDIEDNKINFIKTIIDEYILLFQEPINNLKVLNNSTNNNNKEENIKNKSKFKKHIIENSIILNEKWNIFTYQSYEKQDDLNDFYNEKTLQSILLTSIKNGKIMEIENCVFGDEDEFEILTIKIPDNFYILEDKSEESNIKKLSESFFDTKNINETLFQNVLKIFSKKNTNLYLKFFQFFVNQNNLTLFKFNNSENLKSFNIIIRNILSNLKFNDLNSISYQILYTIILISERTYFDKNFLCALLSDYEYFKDINKWKDLINYRIIYKINKRIKSYIDKSKNEFLEVTNLINNQNYLIESNLSKYLKDYDNLSKHEKEQLNIKEASHIIHSILKDFMNHMCNFKLEIQNSLIIINECCKKYNMEKNMNFYKKYLDTSSYTVRSQYYDIVNKNKRIFKTICYNHNNFNNFELICLSQKKTNKEIYIVLKSLYIFLNDKDLINIMFLNKEISKKIKKKIYIERSKKNLKQKIEKWKENLNYKNLSKNFIYKEIKKKILDNKINTKYNSQINKDSERTSFKNNKKKKQNIISILLKACIYYVKDVGYCQGMNYIIAYLLELTKNEEDSFYIMLGLLNSNFKTLFENDLNKLTIFFYVLEKLIYLKIPEIYEYFKLNKIETNYFSSAYFITLFTNIYPNTNFNINLALINIFDNFIFYGWKNVFSCLLAVLYYNKNIIIEKKNSEDIITYLISEMNKSDIFKNENIDIFCNLSEKFKISKKLYEELNEEKQLESKIEDDNLDLPEIQTEIFKDFYEKKI